MLGSTVQVVDQRLVAAKIGSCITKLHALLSSSVSTHSLHNVELRTAYNKPGRAALSWVLTLESRMQSGEVLP